MDPSKEARILHELTAGGGQTVEEVKNVRKMLAKSNARQAAKHAEKQAARSESEVAKEAKKYSELQQWEQRRQQVNGQQGQQGSTRHQPSIPEVNRQAGLDSFLYEGDMKLTQRQAASVLDLDAEDKAAAAGSDSTVQPTGEPVPAVKRGWKGGPVAPTGSSRPKRQVVVSTSNSFLTWPVADVYYAYDNSVSASNKTVIQKAMAQWAAGTCLAFHEDASQQYTMVFNTATSGCNAPVGLTSGTKNYTISLQSPGCVQVGVAAHEIGHNVGMWHTMSRQDRDDNIYIYTENVDPNYLSQYNKVPATQEQNFSIPYDMGSIMHYDRKAFSYNGSQTMTWSGPTWEWDQTMGQGIGPNMRDFKLINDLYNCDQWCAGQSTITCYGGGFFRKWGTGMCSTCVCPPGVGGSQCNVPAGSDANSYAPPGVTNTCTGARLTATTSWQTLNGSIGGNGGSGNDYAYCHWWIQAPVGYHMVVEVDDVNDNTMPFAQCVDGCTWGYTEVRMGNTNSDWSLPGRHMCCAADVYGQGTSNLTFTATSNAGGREAMISSYVSYNSQSFRLRYKAVSN